MFHTKLLNVAMALFAICAGQEYFLPVFGGDLQQFFKPPFFLKVPSFCTVPVEPTMINSFLQFQQRILKKRRYHQMHYIRLQDYRLL
jgi:hypothetical protein